jgi:Zn-dependent protease
MLIPSFSEIIPRIPAVIIAFAFHEWAHAMVADYFGDPTPRSQGRLSLNPFVHLDIMGTLLAIFYMFGWAKPVQTRPSFYRGNKRRADLFVSAAGSATNLLIGFVAIIILNVFVRFGVWDTAEGLVKILQEIAKLNVAIGVLNLIPLPGLDGYHILGDLLPEEMGANLYRLERYGMIIFVLLIMTGVLGKVLYPSINFFLEAFQTIVYGILSIFGVG